VQVRKFVPTCGAVGNGSCDFFRELEVALFIKRSVLEPSGEGLLASTPIVSTAGPIAWLLFKLAGLSSCPSPELPLKLTVQIMKLLISSHTAPTSFYTERRGRVVNTPASYSKGSSFNIRPHRLAMLIEVFLWFYSVPAGECQFSALKLGHDRFLPDLFQYIIIIHLSSYHHRYVV
jgi:hypothetical protein